MVERKGRESEEKQLLLFLALFSLQGEGENIKLIYYYTLKEDGGKKAVRTLTYMISELRLAQHESEEVQRGKAMLITKDC